METAVLSKRIWVYLIDLAIYLAIGFLSSLPFLLVLHFHVLLYILFACVIFMILSFFVDLIILNASHGFTIGSAIMGVKYVGYDGKTITGKQAFIRSGSETILVFAFIDLIYFLKNRTERGVIDRLSDTFAIDLRR